MGRRAEALHLIRKATTKAKANATADPYGMTTRKAKARTAKFEGEL
jgi:hypothetical protein